tara:strand:+ start:592 stop:891 length:300 start_codon:yes stop_codon:yes gene_type:complete
MKETKLKRLIEEEGITLKDLKIMSRILSEGTRKPDPERVFNLIRLEYAGREVSVYEIKEHLFSKEIILNSCLIGNLLKPCYDQVIKKVNGKTTRLYIIE